MAVVLNGRTIEPDRSILSLALYGYACFTSFAVENRTVKGLRYHLERLCADVEAIIGIPPEEADIRKNLLKFLHECDPNDRIVVRVTVFPADFSAAYPEKINGLEVLVTGRSAGFASEKSLKLATVGSSRTLPLQKSTNMIANLKARAIARERGFDDALMISEDLVTEGATWNIFFQQGDVLFTPELGSGVLPGVTRRLIIEICRQAGVPVVEERIAKDRIKDFDCCFATNSVIGIAPIQSIDGYEFGEGKSKRDGLISLYASIAGERI